MLVPAHRCSVVLVLSFRGWAGEAQATGPFAHQLVNFRCPRPLAGPAALALRWEGHR